MKVKFVILLTVLFVASAAILYFSLPATACSAPRHCTKTVQEVKQRIALGKQFVLLDVRRPEEYTQGHISGSTLLTLDSLNETAEKIIPDKNTEIIVYCRTGRRSEAAYDILVTKGYTNVTDMQGGITAWQIAGFPVEK